MSLQLKANRKNCLVITAALLSSDVTYSSKYFVCLFLNLTFLKYNLGNSVVSIPDFNYNQYIYKGSGSIPLGRRYFFQNESCGFFCFIFSESKYFSVEEETGKTSIALETPFFKATLLKSSQL